MSNENRFEMDHGKLARFLAEHFGVLVHRVALGSDTNGRITVIVSGVSQMPENPLAAKVAELQAQLRATQADNERLETLAVNFRDKLMAEQDKHASEWANCVGAYEDTCARLKREKDAAIRLAVRAEIERAGEDES